MNQLAYIIKFFFRIKWWLILGPAFVALFVYMYMGRTPGLYQSSTTIYTGVVSGYDIESTNGTRQDWNVINNAMDNLINIITSETTLKNVSLRLYARCLTHGNPEQDNQYMTARAYRALIGKTPDDVKALVDRTSEEKTLENLRAYETADHNNHIYGLFHWTPPYFSYKALSQIKVRRIGSSDMLEVSYSNDDPGIVYNTLELLNDEFVQQYKNLRFGETNNVIGYFERELARVGSELRIQEDSLRDYNITHQVINYDEQTKHIAALSRDFELRYEDILLNYESAEKLRATTEAQIDGLQTFRNNAAFIKKLHTIGNLYSKISATQAFETDVPKPLQRDTRDTTSVARLQNNLDRQTRELRDITSQMTNQRYTKEGISTESIVAQWLAAVLLSEKSRAELNVMKERKKELDEKYILFSPVGSTLKRKSREINFSEQSYLSMLQALNTARLRQKNLQMSSATLKILNPPTLPIGAEPSKRKLFVAAAFFCTLVFLIALFILLELLDRTLRDKIRTERITGGKVLGAFPGSGSLKQRRFADIYRQIAAKYMANAALNYFGAKHPNIINLLSTAEGDGKTTLAEQLAGQLRESGLKVRIVSWKRDFDVEQKNFRLASTLSSFVEDKAGDIPLSDADVILVVYPSFDKCSVPKALIADATLNLVVVAANRTWKETDQLLYNKLLEQAGVAPVLFYLNFAKRDVVESFTGLMPPYTRGRKLAYQIGQFGFTAVK